ncbi:hypothetical protein E4659_15475 [Dickeya dianthicola]|uniref:Uncharacterized protein n=1 Tax=Dickeya dianthicola TaxID=204039 RepID=A0ABX9NNP1_9GAMM|nr:hypothetical protein [Dickeya dianthicola]MBI0449280.1 hypothetical protein [Dickeya dianthicola]MBI0453690.1 hypothetical protein [Dickeya dianthicola]MBI0463322.1 hypothetical protein [Dickeya dianthicola]MBI0467119.1 hypothetical protein [Dickeya dianthicola]
MDAAKARAAPDKNVRNVFEQRLRWPEGRAPGMGRVTASRAARTAKANAEGTALAARFSTQPEVKERRRLSLSLSCV